MLFSVISQGLVFFSHQCCISVIDLLSVQLHLIYKNARGKPWHFLSWKDQIQESIEEVFKFSFSRFEKCKQSKFDTCNINKLWITTALQPDDAIILFYFTILLFIYTILFIFIINQFDKFNILWRKAVIINPKSFSSLYSSNVIFMEHSPSHN